jgi:hypothetical protein
MSHSNEEYDIPRPEDQHAVRDMSIEDVLKAKGEKYR